MPVFAYATTDQTGKIVRGRYEGDDEKFVTERLEEKGYRVEELIVESDDAQSSDEAPIVRIVNTILMYAIKDDASDIHVEPQENGRENGIAIRYRIDGVLHDRMKLPQEILTRLVSRIKLMAGLNTAECAVPQSGHLHVQMHDKSYDLQVGTNPTQYGEKIAIAITQVA